MCSDIRYNLGHCNIDKQELNDNSTAINAGTYNNIILEDPFRYYSEKLLTKSPELKNKFSLIEMFINKDKLKERFLGTHSKYEELVNCIINDNTPEQNYLDDGYKSVISCIYNVTKCFEYQNNEENCYLIKGNNNLTGKITTNGLEFFYSNKIQTYKEFLEAAKFAEDLKNKIEPYIICATTYGNFFQFGNIIINKIENVPFIPEKIKFLVSNEIIPNLIEPLYGKNPECGLREIIQNAFDAMKELNSENKIKNYIELNIQKNEVETTLKIRDYGIGMTKEILLNKYFVIGESSKKGINRNLVGQFGIGALAAFLLGDNITVKTKFYQDTQIFSFDYSPDSNEKNPIAVSIIEDKNFKQGTEVYITLNEELSKLTQRDLEKKLRINEWYVLTDFEIKYFYNDKKQKINSYSGKLYEWNSVSNKNRIDIRYLDNKKIEKDGIRQIDNNFKNNPQIIYNGLMVPDEYGFNNDYLNKKPFISVSSFSNNISLNLERSRIEKGLDLIVNPVKSELIRRGLEILKKEKYEIISKDGTILRTSYSNDYLKNLPLFFKQNGFGVSTYSYNSDNKEDILEIYTYLGLPQIKISDLKKTTKYVFKNFEFDKSSLGKLILKNECLVDKDIIKQYFYDATTYRNGFKTATMKYLYQHVFSYQFKPYLSADDFWKEHNKIKESAFRSSFTESEQAFYISKDNKHKDLLSYIKDKTKAKVVVYTKYLNETCNDISDIGIIR